MPSIISPSDKDPVIIIKWKVKEGSYVSMGQLLCLYSTDANTTFANCSKLKSTTAGRISKVNVKEGQIIKPGEVIIEFEACSHTTVMKDLCAECGADLHKDESLTAPATVPMVHSIPELKVTEELAKKLGREDSERLLKDKKLVLLVDLDQTLVHTTNENVPPNMKDVKHFQLKGPWGSRWYHTRLRPGTENFLKQVEKLFELHVCTFGARMYAHAVAAVLDPTGRFFSHRILSRDECFDPTTKAANLKALFPCGDDMVCIIDDREDVWRHAPNLIHVKPYVYFQNTGDINAYGLPINETVLPPIEAKEDEESQDEVIKMPEKVERGNSLDIIEDEFLPLNVNGTDVTPTVDVKKVNENLDDETSEIRNFRKPNDNSKENIEENNDRSKSHLEDLSQNENKEVTQKPQAEAITTEETKSDANEFKVISESNLESKENLNNNTTEMNEDNVQDDPDDYLMYLEDILRRIHAKFYEIYSSSEKSYIPDLKKVIPEVKRNVLADCRLVFSGLVPTHQSLKLSRVYQVAKSLGAEVDEDFSEATTHLVAVHPGTLKVKMAKRLAKPIHIVAPQWLWSCSERWEKVDERLFPLQRGVSNNSRKPPPHCSSPSRAEPLQVNFLNTLNPLLSFSSDDIADMDREVQDIFNESDESNSDSSEEKVPNEVNMAAELGLDDSSISSSSSEGVKEFASRPRKRRRSDDNPPDEDSWSRMGEDLERQLLN